MHACVRVIICLLCVCLHVCMCICIYMYICMYVYMYVYICIQIFIYLSIDLHTYICTYIIYMYVHIYTCICTYVYKLVRVYINTYGIYMYIYAYMCNKYIQHIYTEPTRRGQDIKDIDWRIEQDTHTHRDNSLQHAATRCNTLQHPERQAILGVCGTATHCNSLHLTATLCNTLQHPERQALKGIFATATHCNSLQHSAARCNTLQHAATPWKMSHPRYRRHRSNTAHTPTRMGAPWQKGLVSFVHIG